MINRVNCPEFMRS